MIDQILYGFIDEMEKQAGLGRGIMGLGRSLFGAAKAGLGGRTASAGRFMGAAQKHFNRLPGSATIQKGVNWVRQNPLKSVAIGTGVGYIGSKTTETPPPPQNITINTGT